jgi:two-component system NarL family sensor kinase
MHRWRSGLVIILLLVGAVLLAGCSYTREYAPQNVTAGPTTPLPPRMTPGQLEDLVQDAARYARSAGMDAALAEFSKKEGLFSHGDVYIYAYDFNGTLLAHPYQPEDVGTTRLNFTDIRGLPVIVIGNYTASTGGGFIAYLYPEPEGLFIDEAAKDSYVPKIGYVYPVDDTWWIGSGIYFADLAGANPVPEPVADVIRLEQEGAAYGQKYGEKAAFAEISNRTGIFIDGEGHYLTAYAYNGTVLAHPYLTAAVGMDLSGRKGPFGMNIVRAAADTAGAGGGYVIFIWPNPDAGNREEIKIGYMLPVDENWWIGSGAYLSEVTGEPTYYPAHPG